MNNNQTETIEKKCCIDFCTNTFEVSGQEVVYKCDDKEFSSSDMWNIQKSRRQFLRRENYFVIN
jgi:hypothetical protein